jgi:hypothetical protein
MAILTVDFSISVVYGVGALKGHGMKESRVRLIARTAFSSSRLVCHKPIEVTSQIPKRRICR